jgi:FMN-dependent NADH-azoreductase
MPPNNTALWASHLAKSWLRQSSHAGSIPETTRQPDFLTPYLQHIFTTIGIRSIEFISLVAYG